MQINDNHELRVGSPSKGKAHSSALKRSPSPGAGHASALPKIPGSAKLGALRFPDVLRPILSAPAFTISHRTGNIQNYWGVERYTYQ
jgi:hypothetical protein